MKLRNYILTGLGLCLLTLLFCAFRYPDFAKVLTAPMPLALMTLVVAWNAYAAIRWTHAETSEDAMVLRNGVKWGLAISCAWALVAIVPVPVLTLSYDVGIEAAGAPIWALGMLSALFLPFGCGAATAIKTGRVRIGMRVAFWSGVVSGLIGFLIVMTRGITTELISTLYVGAHPSLMAYVASEREDTLVLAIYIMFLFGTIWDSIAGAIGGWIGLRIYRTGELSGDVTPSISS